MAVENEYRTYTCRHIWDNLRRAWCLVDLRKERSISEVNIGSNGLLWTNLRLPATS